MIYDYFQRALKFLKVSYVVPLDDFLTLLLILYFFSLLPYGVLHTLSGEPSFFYVGLALFLTLIIVNAYHILFEFSRIQYFIVGLVFSFFNLGLMAFICFKSSSSFIWIWFFPGILIFYCITQPLIASFFSLVLIGIICFVLYDNLSSIGFITIIGSYLLLCAFSYFLGFKICRDKKQLSEFLLTDNITGLKNQTALNDLLKNKKAYPFFDQLPKINSVIFFDIDNFKKINHDYGYYSADLIMQRVSNLVKKRLNKKDYFYRCSKKGFVILSEHGEPSIALSNDIKSKIFEAPVFTHAGPVSISCGVAIRENDSLIETIVNRADKALISARIAGGDRSVFLSKDKGLQEYV